MISEKNIFTALCFLNITIFHHAAGNIFISYYFLYSSQKNKKHFSRHH